MSDEQQKIEVDPNLPINIQLPYAVATGLLEIIAKTPLPLETSQPLFGTIKNQRDQQVLAHMQASEAVAKPKRKRATKKAAKRPAKKAA